MCWQTIKTPRALKSDTNKTVFKIGYIDTDDPRFFSGVLGFPYEFDKAYVVSRVVPIRQINFDYNRDYYIIGPGFHSYDAEHINICCKDDWMTLELNGRVVDNYMAEANTVIAVGYIPKGIRYFINEFNEIVSESIVLTKAFLVHGLPLPDRNDKNKYYVNL